MKQGEKQLCKEFDELPAILAKDDIASFLRVSKSSLYKILKKVSYWKDEEEGILVAKEDFTDWLKKNNESFF